MEYTLPDVGAAPDIDSFNYTIIIINFLYKRHTPATVAFINVQVFMTRGRFPIALLVDKIHRRMMDLSTIIKIFILFNSQAVHSRDRSYGESEGESYP